MRHPTAGGPSSNSQTCGQVFPLALQRVGLLGGTPRGLYRTLPRFFARSRWRVIGSYVAYSASHDNYRDSVGFLSQSRTRRGQATKTQLL